jgi:hypothetical protein
MTKRTIQEVVPGQDHSTSVRLIDLFRHYKQFEKLLPENETKKMHHSTYGKILRFMMELVLDDLIFHGIPINMGSLGKIVIEENSVASAKTLRVDWKKTITNRQVCYHFNEHSNYKYYKFKWVKTQHKFCSYYVFRIQRRKKSILSNAILEKKLFRNGYHGKRNIQSNVD